MIKHNKKRNTAFLYETLVREIAKSVIDKQPERNNFIVSLIKEYFTKGTDRYVVNQPLNLLKLADKYDVKINVTGGGTTGQAGAVRLGIARAILKIDAELRGELKSAGFLTRDPRKVERQKAGQKGARAKYQFSKR